ncbi:MAG: T9SS type A sorting domain-containing protein [bacterium]
MKTIILSLLSAHFCFQISFSQETEDPFNWTEPIVIPNSFYLLWTAGEDDNSLSPNLDVYFNYAEGNSIERLRKDSFDYRIAKRGKIALETVNLNDDGIDDLIAAWEAPDSSLSLFLLHPDRTLKIPVNNKIIQSNGEQRRIFVQGGDFDGDGQDEFVVAFIDENMKINLLLYDSHGTTDPELVATMNDEDLSGNSSNKYRFDITSGDLDNNGDDEIAILSYDDDNDPEYENGMYVKIYDLEEETITPRVKSIIMTENEITNNEFSLLEIVLSLTTLSPESSQADILAAALTTIHNTSPNYPDTWLLALKVNSGLDDLVFDDTKIIKEYNNPNFLPPLTLESGDIDGNGSDELVFSLNTSFDVYEADNALNLTYRTAGNIAGPAQQDEELRFSYDYLDINNIDDLLGEEVIVVKNIYAYDFEAPDNQTFNLEVWGVTDGTLSSFSSRGTLENEEPVPQDWPKRSFAIASGSYNNSRITIEAPRYYRTSEVGQPIVILNAPPVHFDQVNGNIYDINSCFEVGSCNFASTYVKTITTSDELTTTVQSAWDVSGGIKYEGSVSTGVTIEGAPFGVGGSASLTYSQNFEYHLLLNYGKNLENTTNRKEEVSVEIEVTAIEDDQIFSTLTEYDVWEYPYFVGDDTENEAGSIWTFIPVQTEARWFPSKSVSGYAYRPVHEVGNILSYYSYDSIENNPDVLEYIQPTSSSPTFTLSANSLYSWTVNRNTFTSNSAFTGISYGVDAGFLGGGFTASTNLNDAHLRTHETQVDTNLNISVSIGGINRSIGPVEYRITPYAYWSKKGALVIDYSVEPEVDLQDGTTWWQEIYGSDPDPTMILPWRLDPEKGFAITDESKREQTKDIQLRPSVISGGDSAIVSAAIRNFSLVNTPGPVKVKFFLGDPDNGGTLISDIYGNSTFETDGIIPARGVKEVSFVWVKPGGNTTNRLYMVIDPDNEITEVHEMNNKGWISTQGTTGATSVESYPDQDVYEFRIMPNPVINEARINYRLDQPDQISIRLYNLSGQLVMTLYQGSRNAGEHNFNFNSSNISPGIYFCSFEGKVGRVNRKVIVGL